MGSYGHNDFFGEDFRINGFSVFPPRFHMGLNGLADIGAGFFLGFTFGVASLQGGTDGQEPSVLIALEHHRELVAIHPDSFLDSCPHYELWKNGLKPQQAKCGTWARPLPPRDPTERGPPGGTHSIVSSPTHYRHSFRFWTDLLPALGRVYRVLHPNPELLSKAPGCRLTAQAFAVGDIVLLLTIFTFHMEAVLRCHFRGDVSCPRSRRLLARTGVCASVESTL